MTPGARRLALGVGCARLCAPDELIALVHASLAEAGRGVHEIVGVWSVDRRSDAAAIHALARELGVPAGFFPAARLEEETPRLANPSASVFARTGTHGVAEAAALAAAGPVARLVIPLRKSALATCAMAEIGGDAE